MSGEDRRLRLIFDRAEQVDDFRCGEVLAISGEQAVSFDGVVLASLILLDLGALQTGKARLRVRPGFVDPSISIVAGLAKLSATAAKSAGRRQSP